MNATELQEKKQQNQELEEKLTKKNTEYIFSLKKAMDELGISETEKVEKLNEMLTEIVDKQKSGQTARSIYGTVTHVTNEMKSPNATAQNKEENTRPLWMWLDNTLLLLAVLGLVSGVSAFITKEQTSTYGLLSTVVMAAVGGGVFYMMYHFIYQYEKPGADRSKRPSMLKMAGIMLVAMFVWMLIYAGTLFVPPVLNPHVSGWVMILIGGLSFLAKMYLKRQFNIASSLQSRR
ncbi:Uncharacterized membrane-anchored protein [Pilibacter termitis]|uniref:Uncharacterized membrane-anchored protein n=1 Tax=Pilibacter termitis TaxID=263852 RepID=A0A1T4QFJ4_9ENTE|nr:DUF1129 family protein [Pilibacter termitis]SKA02484.1 Uncharacterized membrane-anchored protein [Pilibacter termitis]